MRKYGLPNGLEYPLAELVIDGLPGRKMSGQITPLTAGLSQPADGIHNAPQRSFTLTSCVY
ncbi:hypothetical protein GCM10028803_15740 [Larkinella knui]|nr:hypothetical protein [Larkinella knui]